MLKRCPKCGDSKKAIEEFFARRSGKDSKLFYSWCRICVRAHAKAKQAHRRKDPLLRLKVLEQKMKYNLSARGRETKRRSSEISNHIRRQRLLALPWRWNRALWDDCKSAWSHKCAYCDLQKRLTQDHFIPLTDPHCPGTVPGNMVPACIRCNTQKHDDHPDLWVKSRDRLKSIRQKLQQLSDSG